MATKKESILNGLITSLASKISCTFRGQNTDVQSALDTINSNLNVTNTRYVATGINGTIFGEKTLTKGTWLVCFTGTLAEASTSDSSTRDALFFYLDNVWNGVGVTFYPNSTQPNASTSFLMNVTNETGTFSMKEYIKTVTTISYNIAFIKLK